MSYDHLYVDIDPDDFTREVPRPEIHARRLEDQERAEADAARATVRRMNALALPLIAFALLLLAIAFVAGVQVGMATERNRAPQFLSR